MVASAAVNATPARERLVRAAVTRAFATAPVVEEVRLRAPGPGEVGVRIAACAICHSDLIYQSGAWGGTLPAVYGHEAAGVVEEVGDGVLGVAPGDHVVVSLVRACGTCPSCLRGRPALCEGAAALPTSLDPPLRTAEGEPLHQGLRTGAFAERVTVDASQAIPVPRELPLPSAALLGCGVITGVGAVLSTAGAEAGSTVGVVGVGGVGLSAVQGAVLAGASRIVAIDVRPGKLVQARALGATDAALAGPDTDAAIAAATGGRGLEHVVVTAASPRAIEQALGMVAPGGQVVLVGMPPGARVEIDPETIASLGLRILGSKVGDSRPRLDVPRLAELYRAGRLRLDELVSATFPLERIAEALATAGSGDALRCIVVP